MRAVFVLLLAIVAVAFFAPMVSAQPPPRNGSFIAFFNDSACTHHIRNEEIPLPSSSKCVPEHFRRHNESTIFECVTANNQTDLTWNIYNDTAACDNTALISYSSSAPAHTCAPIQLSFEGQAFTAYGHVRCEEDRESRLSDMLAAARQMAPKKAEAEESVVTKLTKKFRVKSL